MLLEQYSVLFLQAEERANAVLEKVAQETHLHNQKILVANKAKSSQVLRQRVINQREE